MQYYYIQFASTIAIYITNAYIPLLITKEHTDGHKGPFVLQFVKPLHLCTTMILQPSTRIIQLHPPCFSTPKVKRPFALIADFLFAVCMQLYCTVEFICFCTNSCQRPCYLQSGSSTCSDTTFTTPLLDDTSHYKIHNRQSPELSQSVGRDFCTTFLA